MKIPGDGQFYYRDFDTLFVTIGRVLLSRYVLKGEKCPTSIVAVTPNDMIDVFSDSA